MRLTAEGNEELEVEFDRDQTLAEMLNKLNDKVVLRQAPTLLDLLFARISKRGVSWLLPTTGSERLSSGRYENGPGHRANGARAWTGRTS